MTSQRLRRTPMRSAGIPVLGSRCTSAMMSIRTRRAIPCTAYSEAGSRSVQVYTLTDLVLLKSSALSDSYLINRDAGPIANPNSTHCAPPSAV
eukprot:IDg14152t1